MAILYSDDVFLEHDTGSHPESSDRLRSIHRHVDDSGLRKRFQAGAIDPATLEQLSRVHDKEYVEYVAQIAERGGGRIDADTVVSRRSYDVARKAAGAAVAAVDNVVGGQHQKAMCLCRPPGHHALKDRGMGFCLFNNVAVAARHAQEEHGLSRILIVDWDVHHGNGTQAVFYDHDEICFFSAHRYPFYPGTGSSDETGHGPGLGSTFNLPLAFGVSRAEYLKRFQAMLERAAEHCRPELVFISAGFDAHRDDPIGSLGLQDEDFGALTTLVALVAENYCNGKIVSLLEGGYNVEALARSVGQHIEALVPKSSSDGDG